MSFKDPLLDNALKFKQYEEEIVEIENQIQSIIKEISKAKYEEKIQKIEDAKRALEQAKLNYQRLSSTTKKEMNEQKKKEMVISKDKHKEILSKFKAYLTNAIKEVQEEGERLARLGTSQPSSMGVNITNNNNNNVAVNGSTVLTNNSINNDFIIIGSNFNDNSLSTNNEIGSDFSKSQPAGRISTSFKQPTSSFVMSDTNKDGLGINGTGNSIRNAAFLQKQQIDMKQQELLERELFKEVFETQKDCLDIVERLNRKVEATSDIAVDSANVLRQQRDELLEIDKELDELGGNVKRARLEITTILRKLAADKIIMILAICVVIAIFIFVLTLVALQIYNRFKPVSNPQKP